MNSIFKKLNFKDQKTIHVINAPESFKKELVEMEGYTSISTRITSKPVSFFIGFVTKQKEVDDLAGKVASLLEEDGTFWMAYPKGSSKRYKCEFNRDNGWQVLGDLGFEGVRMIAIDEDWSALRFRRAEKIKKMSRSFAMSEAGKEKVAAARKKTSK